MAAPAKRKTQAEAHNSQPPPEPESPEVDGKEGLAKLAALTRRVLAVAKDEIPASFAKPKKRRKKPRH